jgi:hypothetical protein
MIPLRSSPSREPAWSRQSQAFRARCWSEKYEQLDFYLPDSHSSWNLVLINDNDKTFRLLWIENPRVAFDGKWLCVPKLTLVVEETREGLVAHARW